MREFLETIKIFIEDSWNEYLLYLSYDAHYVKN